MKGEKRTEKRAGDRNGGIRFNRMLFIGMEINRVSEKVKKEENKT